MCALAYPYVGFKVYPLQQNSAFRFIIIQNTLRASGWLIETDNLEVVKSIGLEASDSLEEHCPNAGMAVVLYGRYSAFDIFELRLFGEPNSFSQSLNGFRLGVF